MNICELKRLLSQFDDNLEVIINGKNWLGAEGIKDLTLQKGELVLMNTDPMPEDEKVINTPFNRCPVIIIDYADN